jgi:RimJ/RimL family protein N-acetyltransferase
LYADLFADPAVAASLWPRALGGPRTARQAAQMLGDDVAHWQEQSFGPWVFFEVKSGIFVGRGGLRRCQLGGGDCVEILYAVRSDAWGNGYATEMASLAIAHARRLELTEVVAFVAITNPASRRVLEKAGIFCAEVIERAGAPHWLGRLATTHAG